MGTEPIKKKKNKKKKKKDDSEEEGKAKEPAEKPVRSSNRINKNLEEAEAWVIYAEWRSFILKSSVLK